MDNFERDILASVVMNGQELVTIAHLNLSFTLDTFEGALQAQAVLAEAEPAIACM